MDEDRIAMVLTKTSELRSKIINCIHNNSNAGKSGKETEVSPDAENEEDEEESLITIKDALECLEGQLSSLQALQQQQWYEKESALAEIEYNQKKLLKELKEYKGKDLEVIHEAIAFASITEENNDLLLPPYPVRPSRSFAQNLNGRLKNLNGISKNLQESESNQAQPGPVGLFNRVKVLMSGLAKTAITVVGVITILSVAGFEPRLKKGDEIKGKDEKESTIECPTGKVAVVENGEIRCVVKERIEIPFEPVVDTPDVSYGCG